MHGCKEKIQHSHVHGKGCGHAVIQHGDHQDFLHNGRLCHLHGDHVDEHGIEVSEVNPDLCTDLHCTQTTRHGEDGSEAIVHGDHTDFLVNGHLHHVHGDHCDDHGPVKVVMH